MNGIAVFFVIVIILLIAAAIGWVIFTQLRARRLGLPAPTLSSYNPFAHHEPSPYGPPTPAPGGIRGWINDKLRGRRDRTAAGAYESTYDGGYNSGRRGFGPLDPDEAWDSRVGYEAENYGPGGYYEEQELSSHTGQRGERGDPYEGSGYQMNLPRTPNQQPADKRTGRPKDRSAQGGGPNPFDDDAAEPSNLSLRGVSPRPIDTANTPKAGAGAQTTDAESPSERRSVFRENV